MKKVLLPIAVAFIASVVVGLILSARVPDRRSAQTVAVPVEARRAERGSSLSEKAVTKAPFMGWDDQLLFATASQRPCFPFSPVKSKWEIDPLRERQGGVPVFDSHTGKCLGFF
jgi:hypothetical protein